MSSKITKVFSYLVLFSILITSLVQPAAAQTTEYREEKSGIETIEAETRQVEPLKQTERGLIAINTTVADHTLTVGSRTSITVQVANPSEFDVTNIDIRLPLPAGTRAVDSADTAWNWTIESLAAGETKEFTVAVELMGVPAGNALITEATLTAGETTLVDTA